MLENYPGAKDTEHVYKTIINNIPKTYRFCELFAGSGAISFELMKVNALPHVTLLNDLSIEVIYALKDKFKTFVKYLNGDAVKVLKEYKDVSLDTLYFLDPPYKHETRPGNEKLYQHEMTDNDHVKLLQTVLQTNALFMIIHPNCDLYDTMLKDWRKVEIKIRYHKKTSIECLYMNYPEPTTLQTYAYLGKDCWERQRIKRKAERMVNKFTEMPVLERNYILNELCKNL